MCCNIHTDPFSHVLWGDVYVRVIVCVCWPADSRTCHTILSITFSVVVYRMLVDAAVDSGQSSVSIHENVSRSWKKVKPFYAIFFHTSCVNFPNKTQSKLMFEPTTRILEIWISTRNTFEILNYGNKSNGRSYRECVSPGNTKHETIIRVNRLTNWSSRWPWMQTWTFRAVLFARVLCIWARARNCIVL